MSISWSTDQVARILGLPRPSLSLPISHITTDSRQIRPGALFVAIAGDAFDGHDFIPEAISKGAIAILSERSGSHETGAFFQVPSTLSAIRSLARAYRQSFNIPLIAVVGAVGKTTTKELISSILHGKYSTILKTEGSQNGFLGIPLTLLNLKPGTDVGVIEIGIDDIGAMEQHLSLVDPTHLILTRTGPEHLHQLKTVEIAAEEELKAFDFAVQHHRPIAINLSDPFVLEWFKKNQARLKGLPHPTYSLNSADHPDYLGTFHAESRVLTLKGSSGSKTFLCPLPGEHHAHNLLAAIVVSRFFGLSDSEIEKGISTFKTAYGRTEIYHLLNGVRVIGDYYNSNPTSLEAALKLLTEVKGSENFHAVLGDMLELGEQEESFHRGIATPILTSGVTHVWLYGPRMKWLESELTKKGFKQVSHFESHELLLHALTNSIQPGAQILIKGSRGMKMEKVLKGILPEGLTP